MESLFVCGLGERDKNLDRLSFFESGKNLFLVLLDAYESCFSDVSLYFDSLCDGLKKNGDLHYVVSHVRPLKIKASLLVCKISEGVVEYISVGDCRLYINGAIATKDDTVAWEKLSRKGFSTEDIACFVCRHPRRHILKEFISHKSIDTLPRPKKINLEEGDILIFSSDGGWEVLDDFFVSYGINFLYEVVKNKSVAFYDNYTFACVRV